MFCCIVNCSSLGLFSFRRHDLQLQNPRHLGQASLKFSIPKPGYHVLMHLFVDSKKKGKNAFCIVLMMSFWKIGTKNHSRAAHLDDWLCRSVQWADLIQYSADTMSIKYMENSTCSIVQCRCSAHSVYLAKVPYILYRTCSECTVNIFIGEYVRRLQVSFVHERPSLDKGDTIKLGALSTYLNWEKTWRHPYSTFPFQWGFPEIGECNAFRCGYWT